MRLCVCPETMAVSVQRDKAFHLIAVPLCTMCGDYVDMLSVSVSVDPDLPHRVTQTHIHAHRDWNMRFIQ